MLRPTIFALLLLPLSLAGAETIRVPSDHNTIQAAIDAAAAGDVVLVGAGNYPERLRLKPGITVRSDGDDTLENATLRRAENTIIDGGALDTQTAGVVMAQGSTLDGFTITGIGRYDQALWQKHFQSQGEELGDDEGSVQAEGTFPAIEIAQVDCVVRNNIVHHNGDVGIAVTGSKQHTVAPLIANNLCYRNMGGGIGIADGAQPIVRDNTCKENLRAGIGCRNADPMILNNTCFGNIRAGIGCREGARPLIRGNACYRNRRAGIGIRMPGTAPVVERNRCYENAMAGIGNRDGAEPIIRLNQCDKNQRAGIGSDGSRPLIVDNQCRENAMAGIGLRGGTTATIQDNVCSDNKLVAIGITANSNAILQGNSLSRSGGMPPIIAVLDQSQAQIDGNQISGGGVAAILVQGTAVIRNNRFQGLHDKQGNAIWAQRGAKVTIADNTFRQYRSAVNATAANVVIHGNTVEQFHTTAIVVRDSPAAAHVYGNTAISDNDKAVAASVQGQAGIVQQNVVRSADPSDP